MRVTCSNGVTVEMLGHNDIRRQRGQLRRVSANFGGIGSPTGHVAALPSPAMDSLRSISVSYGWIDSLSRSRLHVWP
jgi:hypothetical protein